MLGHEILSGTGRFSSTSLGDPVTFLVLSLTHWVGLEASLLVYRIDRRELRDAGLKRTPLLAATMLAASCTRLQLRQRMIEDVPPVGMKAVERLLSKRRLHWIVRYNGACLYSLLAATSRSDTHAHSAIAQLRLVLESNPSLIHMFETWVLPENGDPDLRPIRGHREFVEWREDVTAEFNALSRKIG
jgi:hypothetical protein